MPSSDGAAYLAYVVTHEAWYAQSPGTPASPPPKGLRITYRDPHARPIWEVTVTEAVDGSLDSAVYADTWEVFADVCAWLGSGGTSSLTSLRTVLEMRGATDETVRTGPYAEAAR